MCAETPEVCRTPVTEQKAKLLLRNKLDDRKDKIVWKWSSGAATTKEEFGDPLATDDYVLCVYDGSGVRLSAVAPAGGVCRGPQVLCWADKPVGFNYKNKDLTPNGIFKLSLKAGTDGHAKIGLKGFGALLTMPDLATLTSPVTVQLHRSGGGACWGAEYSFPPDIRNDGVQFIDKAD